MSNQSMSCERLNFAAAPAPKVVIIIEGGIVVDILSTGRVEAAVIDYDTEGADADSITDIPQAGEDTAEAYACVRTVAINPARTMQLWNVTTASQAIL